MKTLVWQVKEFTFYSEITGVPLKRDDERDGAMFMIGKVSLATVYGLDCVHGGTTRKEVYAVALGGCEEGLNEAWGVEGFSHRCEGEHTSCGRE